MLSLTEVAFNKRFLCVVCVLMHVNTNVANVGIDSSKSIDVTKNMLQGMPSS